MQRVVATFIAILGIQCAACAGTREDGYDGDIDLQFDQSPAPTNDGGSARTGDGSEMPASAADDGDAMQQPPVAGSGELGMQAAAADAETGPTPFGPLPLDAMLDVAWTYIDTINATSPESPEHKQARYGVARIARRCGGLSDKEVATLIRLGALPTGERAVRDTIVKRLKRHNEVIKAATTLDEFIRVYYDQVLIPELADGSPSLGRARGRIASLRRSAEIADALFVRTARFTQAVQRLYDDAQVVWRDSGGTAWNYTVTRDAAEANLASDFQYQVFASIFQREVDHAYEQLAQIKENGFSEIGSATYRIWTVPAAVSDGRFLLFDRDDDGRRVPLVAGWSSSNDADFLMIVQPVNGRYAHGLASRVYLITRRADREWKVERSAGVVLRVDGETWGLSTVSSADDLERRLDRQCIITGEGPALPELIRDDVHDSPMHRLIRRLLEVYPKNGVSHGAQASIFLPATSLAEFEGAMTHILRIASEEWTGDIGTTYPRLFGVIAEAYATLDEREPVFCRLPVSPLHAASSAGAISQSGCA